MRRHVCAQGLMHLMLRVFEEPGGGTLLIDVGATEGRCKENHCFLNSPKNVLISLLTTESARGQRAVPIKPNPKNGARCQPREFKRSNCASVEVRFIKHEVCKSQPTFKSVTCATFLKRFSLQAVLVFTEKTPEAC